MTEDILRMRGITKRFPGVLALSGVDLGVKRASIHALVGENGAGKSTLMKMLSGVYAHGDFEGDIEFDGRPAQFRNIRDSEASGVVIIHQELALVGELSIAENIFLGNERKSRGFISWDRTNTEAARLMKQVGLNDNPATLVEKIGVGKQQLVEIAKALSKNVKLLILDEPTAALNDTDSENLLELLRALREEGVTSIIISHKLGEVLAVADRITVLRDGKSIETLENGAAEVSEDRLIKSMVGRDLEHLYPPHEPSIGEVFFEVEDWTVHHPEQRDRVIVNNASLNVARGEIVGLAGLMGAGRTEFAMSLFGRSWGSNISGHATMDGKALRLRNVPDAIDAGLAYATEDRKHYGLHLEYDLRENFTLPGLGKLSKRGVVDQDRHQRRLRAPAQGVRRQGPVGLLARREPLRRQPAEDRARQMGVHRTRAAHPRRADPRHRRRRQVRDLRADPEAGRPGQGGPHDLLRTARAARHVRPHLRDERRAHHRPGRPRERHTGRTDAPHDS